MVSNNAAEPLLLKLTGEMDDAEAAEEDASLDDADDKVKLQAANSSDYEPEPISSSAFITLRTVKRATTPLAGDDLLTFIRSQRGAPLLVHDGYVYRCERKSAKRTYWLCVGYKRFKCNARIICEGNRFVKATVHYNHDADADRIERGLVEYRSLADADRNAFLNSVQK